MIHPQRKVARMFAQRIVHRASANQAGSTVISLRDSVAQSILRTASHSSAIDRTMRR